MDSERRAFELQTEQRFETWERDIEKLRARAANLREADRTRCYDLLQRVLDHRAAARLCFYRLRIADHGAPFEKLRSELAELCDNLEDGLKQARADFF